MFRGSVTVKKCLARPINVLWSQRGSLMFMEVEISAAMVVLRGQAGKQVGNHNEHNASIFFFSPRLVLDGAFCFYSIRLYTKIST